MTVESLVQTIQTFIHTYGLLAVFVYLALETGMILHFAPSEIVVPFAAAELVHGPFSFLVFVLVATTGATIGAVFPYAIFRRYGRIALDRYGRYVHITPEDVDRGEDWFRRWGESSVLGVAFCRSFEPISQFLRDTLRWTDASTQFTRHSGQVHTIR